MTAASLTVVILLVVAAALAVAAVLSFRQKKLDAAFLQGASAAARSSRVNVSLDQSDVRRLVLNAAGTGRGQFELRRVGVADRLAEDVGLASEGVTSDSDFLKRYHIDCDDAPFVSAFFSDADKRAAVDALFSAGCTSLSWDCGAATAVWKGFRPRGDDGAFVAAAAAALRALTIGVPEDTAPPPASLVMTEWLFGVCTGAAVFLGCLAAYAALAFPLLLPGRPLNPWSTFMASLRFSGPPAALFVLAGAAKLRGKSWFLKGVGKLVMAAAAVFAPLGYMAYCEANCLLDRGPASSYVLPVVEATRDDGGRSASYYFDVSSCPGCDIPTFSVDRATFDRYEKGRTQARLTTRPGFFGRAWIVSLAFAQS